MSSFWKDVCLWKSLPKDVMLCGWCLTWLTIIPAASSPLKISPSGRIFPTNIWNRSLPSWAAPDLSKAPAAPQGGYMLAKEPQEYTVGEILRLLEGNLAPVACVDDTKEACTRADECVTMEVWREIKDAVNKVVDNITLADLVEQQRQKCRCCK